MRIEGTELAVRVGGAVVVGAAAVLAATVEAFLIPFHLGATPVPLGGALAFSLNWALAALAVWWTGGRWGAVLTAGAWFVVILFASAPSPGGSLVITSGTNGYALLLAGTAGIAVSLWQYFRPRPKRQQTPLSVPKESEW